MTDNGGMNERPKDRAGIKALIRKRGREIAQLERVLANGGLPRKYRQSMTLSLQGLRNNQKSWEIYLAKMEK